MTFIFPTLHTFIPSQNWTITFKIIVFIQWNSTPGWKVKLVSPPFFLKNFSPYFWEITELHGNSSLADQALNNTQNALHSRDQNHHQDTCLPTMSHWALRFSGRTLTCRMDSFSWLCPNFLTSHLNFLQINCRIILCFLKSIYDIPFMKKWHLYKTKSFDS